MTYVAPRPVSVLSLFSGVSGLGLGVRLAIPESRHVCYVEREFEACEVLAARMADRSLDSAPIYTDVTAFDGKPWNGIVDLIEGGFPCTDLSVAGRQAGIHGEHSGLWFEYLRIIREVEPRWVLIENVPAVIAFPAGGIVLGGLAESGFDAEWLSVRASDVGASHGRARVFILAHRQGRGLGELREPSWCDRFTDRGDKELADTARHERAREGRSRRAGRGVRETGDALADPGRFAGTRDGGPVQRGQHKYGPDAEAGSNTLADAGNGFVPEPGRGPEGRDGARPADAVLADTERGSAQCKHQPGRARRRRSEPPRDIAGLADTESAERRPDDERVTGEDHKDTTGPGGRDPELGHADIAGLEGRVERGNSSGERLTGEAIGELADADREERRWEPDSSQREGRKGRRTASGWDGESIPLFAPGPGAVAEWQRLLTAYPYLAPALSTEEIESILCGDPARSAIGVDVKDRTDRLRSLGNLACPLQAAFAITILAARLTT